MSSPLAATTAPNPSPTERGNALHLAYIRTLPCLFCGRLGPSDPAHIRTGTDGGIGLKPSDRFTVPLCRDDHRHQHQVGERTFWHEVGMEIEDVVTLALALWDVSGSRLRGEAILAKQRKAILDFKLFGL
jgi:hypothetical protein